MKCVATFAELFKYFKILEFNHVYNPSQKRKKERKRQEDEKTENVSPTHCDLYKVV